MAMYPEVQKRAHQELDNVIGSTRLPDFDDRKSLPYIEAMLSEIFRWQPVAPLGKICYPAFNAMAALI